MNPPRIAYVCADAGVPVFGRKGCSIHVQEVVRALRACGAEVSLFAARLGDEKPPDLGDVPAFELPCPHGDDIAERERFCLAANQDLTRALEAAGPIDFVYERFSLWSFAAMTWARTHRIPGLLEVNAPLIEEQNRHRSLADRASAEQAATFALENAAALIAVSDEVAGYLHKRGIDPSKVHVVPNGVNPDRFPETIAPKWLWPEEEKLFTVGFVGSLKPWHGVSVLIDAFAQFQAGVASARLVIVGDGPEGRALRARVAELGLDSRIQFTGTVAAEEVPALIAAMDVAVAPYPASEDFYFSPLKVYEYMAAARAVVTSRVGQLSKLIQDGENGLFCEPGNAADLAVQLGRLYSDAAWRTQLGQSARTTILSKYTWANVAKRVLTLAGYSFSRKSAAESAASACCKPNVFRR